MKMLNVSASELPGREYDIAVHFTNGQGLPDAEYVPAAQFITYAASRHAARHAWQVRYGKPG